MASTADQLAALGADSSFRARVQSILIQVAAMVYAEAPATPDTRRAYAKQVLGNPVAYSAQIVYTIASRTNFVAGNVTYDFSTSHVKTDVTDAAIFSQISADWNMLAGM